jgi:flavin-dependent dehydrogenase
LSGEWFQSIGPYEVLDTEPFQSQSSGVTLISDVIHELESITNFAIGIEHALDAGRRVYGSFWTDLNAAKEDSVANVSGSPFDLYHFGGGYSFPVGRSDVTLGAVVAIGSAETTLDLKPPDFESGRLDTSYMRVTFILGFNFALATGG